MRFQGKVALITAAASGIGRATANIIGREGGRVAAVDNNRERLDATVAEIAAGGGEAHPYCADALQESEVDSVVADAARRFGRIDILVNDAAFNKTIQFSDLDGMTHELWNHIMTTNLTSAFICSRAVAPLMRAQGQGRIQRIEAAGRVLVEDAHGAPPTLPFWFGEAPLRTAVLSSAVSDLREAISARTSSVSPSNLGEIPTANSAVILSAAKDPCSCLVEPQGLDDPPGAPFIRVLCE